MNYDAKARESAKQSIGRKMKIRFAPQTSVRGVIQTCTFVGWKTKGAREIAQYRVTLAAGKGEVCLHTFHVLCLPNAKSDRRSEPEVRACEFTANAFQGIGCRC
jgi:hypothetical protein